MKKKDTACNKCANFDDGSRTNFRACNAKGAMEKVFDPIEGKMVKRLGDYRDLNKYGCCAYFEERKPEG